MITTVKEREYPTCISEDGETLQVFCGKICEYSRKNNTPVMATWKNLYPMSVFPLSYQVDIETIFRLKEQLPSCIKKH